MKKTNHLDGLSDDRISHHYQDEVSSLREKKLSVNKGNGLTSSSCSSLKTEEWMTTEEAAKFLRISKSSLLNLSSNGKVPYYKLERRNRYLKSDLLQLLLSNRRGGFNGN